MMEAKKMFTTGCIEWRLDSEESERRTTGVHAPDTGEALTEGNLQARYDQKDPSKIFYNNACHSIFNKSSIRGQPQI